MDVNLPDGRILRNVPAGTTKEQILARLKAAGENVSWAEQKPEGGAESLAKQTGFGEAMLVGAGSKTNDILNGLTQLYLKARGEDKALGGLAQNVQAGKDVYEPLRRERPFATGLGEALPTMAVPGAGAGFRGAMAAGAIPELLSYGSAEDRLVRGGTGAAGGAVGRVAAKAIGTFLKPAGTSPNEAAMLAAERIGFKPLAGQATQNPALLNVENFLGRHVGSSGTMQNIAEAQQKAINKAAASSIGQTGEEVTPGLLSAAKADIGSKFGALEAKTAPQLGPDFLNALLKIESSNASLGPFRSGKIDDLLNKSLDLAAKGNLSGAAYKEIRSELSAQAQSAFKTEGNAQLGQALKTVRNALDDAAEKSLSKADQKAWSAARGEWGNLKTLLKGNVAEAGDVSAARVAQSMRGRGPEFRLGNVNGPLADVARVGEAFKGPLNPNSGNLSSTSFGVLAAPVNFTAAQIYTLPIVQRYLRDGIIDIGKNGELILKATGVPLGAAAMNGLLGAE